jgi:hypothetical protein
MQTPDRAREGLEALIGSFRRHLPVWQECALFASASTGREPAAGNCWWMALTWAREEQCDCTADALMRPGSIFDGAFSKITEGSTVFFRKSHATHFPRL